MIFALGASAQTGGEPQISNQSPTGSVNSGSITISVDTADLARCRYNSTDVSFDSMEGVMNSPDGLSHTASLGTLANGSYTYYVRCKDFAGNANSQSQVINFNVGGGSSPIVPPPSAEPKLSKLGPSGTLYQGYTTLSVTTDEAADCRFSSHNKSYDAMTLQFQSSDQLLHTYDLTIPSYGTYTYYVICSDNSSNVSAASKISFRYKSLTPVNTGTTPTGDTTPPVIDTTTLGPTGSVTASPATLTATINEAGTCKYDVTDVGYDTMANTFDQPASGNTFTKSVTLSTPGPYTYYVRCKDSAGNVDTTSAQITFTYSQAVAPVISNAQPPNASNVYQAQVGLQVNTDVTSDCRYSTADMDYDAMQDGFSTNDNLLHQATVNLTAFGPYIYYVRCESKTGAKDTTSTAINFTYQNPSQNGSTTTTPNNSSGTVTMGTSDGKCDNTQDNVCDPDCPAAPDPGADPDCSNIKPTTAATSCGDQPITMGVKDGECNNAQDYVCDPDCPPAPDSNADPDCACYYQQHPKNNNGVWMVLAFIGLLVVIAIVVVVVILKKKGSEDDESIETLE